MTSLLRRLTVARAHRGDEGAAMLIVLSVLMVSITLTVLLSAVVINQTTPLMFQRKSTKTLHGAEAGLDFGLNRVRDAYRSTPQPYTDPTGNTVTLTGDQSKLPCTAPGIWTQNLNLGAAGTSSVTIMYFDDDPLNNPVGHDYTWRNAHRMSATSSKPVSCPFSLTGPAPLYAVVMAATSSSDLVGTNSARGNRALETIYTFQMSNVRINGGLLVLNAGTMCMDAGAGTTMPANNNLVVMKTCAAAGSTNLAQRWTYDRFDRLVVYTDPTNQATGLCLQVANTVGTQAKVVSCLATPTSIPVTQIWNMNNSRHFEGTATATTKSGNCLNADPSNKVLLQSCSGTSVWTPDTTVGAGSANATNNYFVNFERFGYCLDQTNFDVNWAYIILYPCKIDPAGAPWNHQWYRSTGLSANPSADPGLDSDKSPNEYRGQMYLKGYSTSSTSSTYLGKYCITLPSAAAPAVGTVPVLDPCSASDTRQTWHYTGKQPSYKEGYTLRPGANDTLCLTYSTTLYHQPTVPEIVLAKCDGTDSQKWDAPPQTLPAGVDNERETTGGR